MSDTFKLIENCRSITSFITLKDLLAMVNPNLSSFIWSVVDLLHGDYKQFKYGKVTFTATPQLTIDLLQELLNALISTVTTGQVDV